MNSTKNVTNKYDLKNDLNDFKQRIQTLENFSKWNNMCPKYAKQQHLNTKEGKGMDILMSFLW